LTLPGHQEVFLPEATLSVVMVTLDEEGAIGKVVTDLKKTVPQAEIVVVDSSSDQTAAIAERLGCRVIRQFPPQGYGQALGTALRSAGGDIVITLDCDDTYPVEDIPRLVTKMQESDGFDIVSGSRMARKSAGMSPQNFIANWLFALAARVLCGVPTTDVHTGMRAYRRSLLNEFDFDAKGMALPVELLIGPAQRGYRVTEIFIDYRPRIGVTTLRPIEGTWWTLKRLWKWRKR